MRNKMRRDTFEKNEVGTDYFVGDIHGMYDALMYALDIEDFNCERDRLFAVGDLIDRGPDSEKVLRLLEESWFFSVMGNHEDLLLGTSYSYDIWYHNGGEWAFDNDYTFIPKKEVIEEFSETLEKLPIAITVRTKWGNIGVIHTDPPEDWEIIYDPIVHLWGRTRVQYTIEEHVKGIDAVVMGHTPKHSIITVLGNVLNLDAGAYENGEVKLINAEQVINSVS